MRTEIRSKSDEDLWVALAALLVGLDEVTKLKISRLSQGRTVTISLQTL